MSPSLICSQVCKVSLTANTGSHWIMLFTKSGEVGKLGLNCNPFKGVRKYKILAYFCDSHLSRVNF